MGPGLGCRCVGIAGTGPRCRCGGARGRREPGRVADAAARCIGAMESGLQVPQRSAQVGAGPGACEGCVRLGLRVLDGVWVAGARCDVQV